MKFITGQCLGALTFLLLAGFGLPLRAAAPSVDLEPSNLRFRSQVAGTSSSTGTIKLVNEGNARLKITSITATGAFAQTNNCPANLAPNSRCQIRVTFAPPSTGPFSGSITIVDNANRSPQEVVLSGTGILLLSVSRDPLSFGNQVINTTSAAQAIRLTNTNPIALPITSIVPSGDFAQTNNCGTSLPPHASCTIDVNFTPTKLSLRLGVLTVKDAATSSPQIVGLFGTGTVTGLVSIAVTPQNSLISPGGTQQFTATGTFSHDPPQNLTDFVTWTSSAAAVATISNATGSQGLAKAIGTGTTTIRATLNAISASVLLAIEIPPTISALTESSADPFSVLTITGTGFNPLGDVAISVQFAPEGVGAPIDVPVFSATPNTLQVIVPPFFNQVSGAFSAGTVDVQVIQSTASVVSTSNIDTGLAITALPSLPSGLAPGAVTTALISGELNVIQSIQNAANGASNLNPLASQLTTFESDLNSLTPFLNTVQPAAFPTSRGAFVLDFQNLAFSDQLGLAYLGQFLSQVQPASPAAATPCPSSTGNNTVDSNVCQMQRNAQQVLGSAVNTTSGGVGLLSGGYLVPLSGLASEISSDGGAAANEAANGYQIFLNAIASYVAAYSTSSPAPAFSVSLADAGTPAIASFAEKAGTVFLPSTMDALNVYSSAESLASSTIDPGANGGLIFSDPPAILIICPGPACMPGSIGRPPSVLPLPISMVGPTVQVTPTDSSLVTINVEIVKLGGGDGKVISSPLGIACESVCEMAFPVGPGVVLTAIPDAPSGSFFAMWEGGACSGGSPVCFIPTLKGENAEATAVFANGPEESLTLDLLGNGSGTVSVETSDGAAPDGFVGFTTNSGGIWIPNGISCVSGRCAALFPDQTPVTLKAASTNGSSFVGWGGACSGSNLSCSLLMNTNKVVTATFALGGTTTYTYTGNPFNQFTNACPVCAFPGARITASLTYAAPLPPNMSLRAMPPLSWTITDGVTTISSTAPACTSNQPPTTNVCQSPPLTINNYGINVGTDGLGNINTWSIFIAVEASNQVTDALVTVYGPGGLIDESNISVPSQPSAGSGLSIFNDPGTWAVSTSLAGP